MSASDTRPSPNHARESVCDERRSACDERVPSVREEAVVWRDHGDQLLVFEFVKGGFYLLNRSAAAVFRLVDGERSIARISDMLPSVEVGDLFALLGDLERLGVMTTTGDPRAHHRDVHE